MFSFFHRRPICESVALKTYNYEEKLKISKSLETVGEGLNTKKLSALIVVSFCSFVRKDLWMFKELDQGSSWFDFHYITHKVFSGNQFLVLFKKRL